MPETPTYATALGFVQFDPQEREVNNQKVLNITIRSANTNNLINITLWPEVLNSQDFPGVQKGDCVVVDGKVTLRDYTNQQGEKKTATNMSASNIAIIAGVTKLTS